MSVEENHTSLTFDNPTENRQIIETILKELVDLDNLKSLIQAQKLVNQLLNAYVITNHMVTTNNQCPPMPELLTIVENHIKKGIMKLNDEEVKNIKTMNESLTDMIFIQKKIQRTKKSFHQKLTKEVENENTTIWSNMTTWLSKQIDPLVKKETIKNEMLFKKVDDWVTRSKEDLAKALEIAVKDVLHSLVNQQIILKKINAEDGWKKDMETKSGSHAFMATIEKEMKNDVKQITDNYDAPFIDTFSNELYTRCYKQLLAPVKKKDPTNLVKELIGDINLQLLKKDQWPTEIQDLIDNELLLFLEYICNEAPNIKDYARKKFNTIKTISSNNELTNKQKKSIQKTYFKLYKACKKYETTLQICAEKNNTIPNTSLGFIQQLCQTIEMVHHEYRPFLISMIQQYQQLLQTTNPANRKQLLGKYSAQLERKQTISKTLELARYITQAIQKNPPSDTLEKNEWVKQYVNEAAKKFSLVTQPWKETDWKTDLNQIIEIMGIKTQPEKNNRTTKNYQKTSDTSISSMLNKTPTVTEEVNAQSTLNNPA